MCCVWGLVDPGCMGARWRCNSSSRVRSLRRSARCEPCLNSSARKAGCRNSSRARVMISSPHYTVIYSMLTQLCKGGFKVSRACAGWAVCTTVYIIRQKNVCCEATWQLMRFGGLYVVLQCSRRLFVRWVTDHDEQHKMWSYCNAQ